MEPSIFIANWSAQEQGERQVWFCDLNPLAQSTLTPPHPHQLLKLRL